jgi:hypothetical protein
MKEEELEECKLILKKNYKEMYIIYLKSYIIILQIRMETYKHWSAQGKLKGLVSISLNAYTEFITKHIHVIDSPYFTLADSDTLFIYVNGKEQSSTNSVLSLVRYEFLEIIFRIALKRFYKSKILLILSFPNFIFVFFYLEIKCLFLGKQADSPQESVKKFLNEYFMNMCSDYDNQIFRDLYYWNEKCDNVLKAYLPLLNKIFNMYGGTHRKPSEKMYN